MHPAELNITFPTAQQFRVAFGEAHSETTPFNNPVSTKDHQDIAWYIETYAAHSLADPDDQEAQRIETRLGEIGQALFTAVFSQRATQRLFNRLQDSNATQRLITIDSSSAAILSLPWELLHDPAGMYLFRERPSISIRRRISGATGGREAFPIQPKAQLHLLFVVSRPKEAGFIDPRTDPKAVMDALDKYAPGRASIEFLRPATLNALNDRLNDTHKPPVDILHFDGHGAFIQNPADDAQGQGFLLFEKDDQTNHLVSAQTLSENLYRANISLVVLSACQSAKLDDPTSQANNPMASVAGSLARTGIPAVLAMTHAILVATTGQLFGRFYQSLARQRSIANALDDARTWLTNNPEKFDVRRDGQWVKLNLQDWFLTTLYYNHADAPLLGTEPPAQATSQPTQHHNLRPAHEAGFYGRSRELWEIEYGFANQNTRRISITGFGGQGKTELALEAARWLLRINLIQQAVFVDYAKAQGDDAVGLAVSTIAAVTQQNLPDADATTRALAQTPTLLILDNLEALKPDSLNALLDAAKTWSEAGDSRVLLTSRQPDFHHPHYKTSGSFIHRRIPLQGLNPADALDWYAELNKLPIPNEAQRLPIPKREALLGLFEQVGFHPLSIAVLAQQLAYRTPDELSQRLETILSSDAESLVAEEGTPKSLVASLQLSLERLGTQDRAALNKLGVFAGGAMEDNLLAVTGMDADKHWPPLRTQLEAAALIEAERIPGVDVPYLRFHPTLAPMLWARLNQQQQDALKQAHSQRYYQLTSYLYRQDDTNPHQARAIAQRELPNLLQAVRHMLGTADQNAVVFVDSVNKFLHNFGLNREAEALTRAVAEQASQNRYEIGSEAWFLALSNQGKGLFQAGKTQQALGIFQQIEQGLGKKPTYNLALILDHIGRCYAAGGRPELAEAQYRQGIQVIDSLEQTDQVQRHRGILHTDLADVLTDQGRLDEAAEQYQVGLEIAKQQDDKRTQGTSLIQIGTLAMEQGDLAKAIQHYQQALTLFQQLIEPGTTAIIHHQLGIAFRQTKQWALAEQHYRKSANLKETNGNLAGAAQTWNNLAILCEHTDRPEAAETWYRKAIEDGGKIGDYLLVAHALINLAGLLQHQPNRLDEAHTLAEQALAIKQNLEPGAAEIWKTYELLAQITD